MTEVMLACSSVESPAGERTPCRMNVTCDWISPNSTARLDSGTSDHSLPATGCNNFRISDYIVRPAQPRFSANVNKPLSTRPDSDELPFRTVAFHKHHVIFLGCTFLLRLGRIHRQH